MQDSRFESLVEEHKDAVYRQLARVCGHQEDAEDALASALMLAFQKYESLNSPEAFRTWLAMIGRRVCFRMKSHPAMVPVWEMAEKLGLDDAEIPQVEMQVLKGCINEAIDGLSETYREVYVLCEIEERTVPEAAAMLGISEAAAKSRLLRAREMVRDQLDHSICAI